MYKPCKALETLFISVEWAKYWAQILKLKPSHTEKNKLMFC